MIKTCPKGHTFDKTSDCPSCPTCEREAKPNDGFLSLVAAPARRALVSEGITTLEILANKTENEILALHGIGKSALPKLRSALKGVGLSFKK